MFMVCEPPRPQVGQAPHPKSKRSRRRNRPNRHAQRNAERLRAAEAARAKAEADQRAIVARELAYFAKWPESSYPGKRLPGEYGRFKAEATDNPKLSERQAKFIRKFEQWQAVRARLFRWEQHRGRLVARSLGDRIVMVSGSVEYLDMRYWLARQCGFNASNDLVWAWWTGELSDELRRRGYRPPNVLTETQRLWFVDASRGKGMYFNQRRAWARDQKRRAA
jgi:hypothetical protein